MPKKKASAAQIRANRENAKKAGRKPKPEAEKGRSPGMAFNTRVDMPTADKIASLRERGVTLKGIVEAGVLALAERYNQASDEA